MFRLFIILTFVLLSFSGFPQYNYDFNETCREAYSAIISLKFGEGKALIEKEKQLHPDNNIPYLLDNYIYFLTIFIGEEEAVFNKYDDQKDVVFERLKAGDKNSPYYRYCLALANLQWAVARTKFNEYISATFEINRAYRLLEDNNEEFPEFLPNLINLGLLHTLIGTVPDNYNWIKRLVGVEGTIDQGVDEILKVLDASLTQEEYKHYKAECLFYLSFIQINLMSTKEKALEYLEIIERDSSNLENPLAIYAISRVYMDNGMNDQAIKILLNRPTGHHYYPFYFLDYLTGLAKLHRLDADANKYFYKYVINFKGINYIKEAYQKIAWYYLINGDQNKYEENIDKVKKYGSDIVDADKQALREAERKDIPNPHLLKARLLFDGGYYEKALDALSFGNSSGFLRNSTDSLEFTYRLGRIYDDWGKPDESIPYYQRTIEKGAESPTYFAANSALRLGIIYENKGDYEKAGYYYDKAQSMKNEEYRNSINQKAKAGEQRIENHL
ncbi:MAG: tetratricopeptide repeat protein [Bacteroidales bacterium]|nr:tetratricopeptide repeat protein [Bacteroidales bacterium]